MSFLVRTLFDPFLGRIPALQAQIMIRLLYKLPGFTTSVSCCPVCGGKPDRIEYNAQYSPLDHCPDCGHVYTRTNPGQAILRLMYKDLDYWKQDKEHQGITKIEDGPQWQGFIDARIGAMRNCGVFAASEMKFLEIGCSEGILLRALENLGHEALGCECNRPTAEAGMKALGVRIKIGLFDEFQLPQAYYDAVASFHTIEHIPDLGRTFDKIVDVLKPDGTVFIEVPTGPEEYANTDHVQFFSDASLKRFLERYFEVGETVPNLYSTADGTQVGSLYGIGRRPRKQSKT
jgi:2-polyprenyl-3-methyl-5-hydroxy-6-metoxy-1,4-benzoquinol methylase